MINSNDLRLGNLVYNDNNEVYVITWLNNSIINLINPIPITKEYLLRCGFVDNGNNEDFTLLLGCNSSGNLSLVANDLDALIGGDDILYNGFCICIDFDDEEGSAWWTYGNKEGVYYVHELQNLYYTLMGKELVFN